ncbi:MAG: DNA polymerase III subunit beta [Bacillota bacterium]
MHLSVNTGELRHCLETVEKALPSRSTMPVISNILLEINHKELTFSATNLEMFIKTRMLHTGDDTGKILLPPKLVDIIRYFPTDKVDLEINWDNYRLDISGGSSNFHLYGSNPEDYPSAFDDAAKKGQEISIDQYTFKKMLKLVIFAASNEETRPAFNGVLFTFKKGYLSLTASDTYRLALKESRDNSWSTEEMLSLVPARSMRELLRLTGEEQIDILIKKEKNIISFQIEEIFFATRLLEEKFPDVSGVIPKEYKTRVTLNKKSFEEMVNRASLLAEGKNQAVNLIVRDGHLDIKVSSQQGSMEDTLPALVEGEIIDIFANTRFVLDVLKVIDEEDVILEFHGAGGPILFKLANDKGYLYLVLPIKKVN